MLLQRVVASRTAKWAFVLLLVILTGLYGYKSYENTLHEFTDWIAFEVGARVLVHYQHQPIYSDPRLHLYVDNPDLQIGPPPLLLVAAFEGLYVRTIAAIFCAVIPALGVIGILSITGTGPRWAADLRSAITRTKLAVAALVVGGIWGFEAGQWRHLDDAMALCFTALAVLLIVRRPGWWWLIGLLLGTAVASKPWAIILTPILLGLKRREVSRAVLVTVGVAAAWWAPFVIAAPQTLQALGRFPIQPHGGSVLYLIGIHGHIQRWLRPVQFIVGTAVGVIAARRHGICSAPIAALATRVLTDPYAYPYYGLGPLLFAYLFDRARPNTRWFVGLTELTVLLDFGFARIWGAPAWVASGKLAWGLITLGWVFLGPKEGPRGLPRGEHQTASVGSEGLADPPVATAAS